MTKDLLKPVSCLHPVSSFIHKDNDRMIILCILQLKSMQKAPFQMNVFSKIIKDFNDVQTIYPLRGYN